MLNPNKDITDWNQIAQNYSKAVGVPDDRTYQQYREVLWESLGTLERSSVLDLGCGHGWLSHELLKAGASVIGVDGSKALLGEARKNYPEISFVEHDLTKGLPLLNQMFDCIVANMVLMDLPVLELLLTDVQKYLKPKGHANAKAK